MFPFFWSGRHGADLTMEGLRCPQCTEWQQRDACTFSACGSLANAVSQSNLGQVAEQKAVAEVQEAGCDA